MALTAFIGAWVLVARGHGRRSANNVEGTPPLPLEVDPLNPAREFGEGRNLPSGSSAEPQPTNEMVHCIFLTSGGNKFNNFRDNHLTISTKMSIPKK